MMKRLLLALATWIWKRYGDSGIPSEVLSSARELTSQWADSDVSGEYKRHQVYAALQKRHPEVLKRILSRSIDEVLR